MPRRKFVTTSDAIVHLEKLAAKSDKPKSNGPDDLYSIQIEPGPVKIGRTANVRQRIGHIQCASPYEVKVLATITGGGRFERKIHHHLRECRLRGEWFRWTNIVSDLVDCVKAEGDWESLLREFDGPPVPDDDWRIGSPLYAGNPKYPQYQLPSPLPPTERQTQ